MQSASHTPSSHIRRKGHGLGALGRSRGRGAGRTRAQRTCRKREGVGATGSPTTLPERRDTPKPYRFLAQTAESIREAGEAPLQFVIFRREHPQTGRSAGGLHQRNLPGETRTRR
jgi:hypothetical protein